MKIVVLGYVLRCPLGGMSAAYLQYVLGLKDLGHEVVYYEDSDNYASCYNPQTFELTTDPKYGLDYIKRLFRKYDLEKNWIYYDDHTGTWYGRNKQNALAFFNVADLVINISGVNPLRDWWTKIPVRVFVDTDPAFTQIKNLSNSEVLTAIQTHTNFFTLAENIRYNNCLLPVDGVNYLPTRQPICLSLWKVDKPVLSGRWTTVMQWDSYATREYEGRHYGMKSSSFEQFKDLPSKIFDEEIELALGSDSASLAGLQEKGWKIIDPIKPTRTFETYQQFIQQSKGEWSIAKQGYVVTNSGWFSERSACYLASGKPVVVQGTGFAENIATGKGLFSFNTLQEAIESFEIINKDYHFHCLEARKLAEAAFDSRKVLGQLLLQI
jgi:hypothetical protein